MIGQLFSKNNTWTPDDLQLENIEACLSEAAKNTQGYLAIFKIEPYIDSVYVRYQNSEDELPVEMRRFVFHEEYYWNYEDEKFFATNCVDNQRLRYTHAAIDQIYKYYSQQFQEWHLNRYYTKNLRLLDHIYHCMRKGTAKEILYKAGLDELAANIEDVDEYNLLSSKPTEIYDGVSLRVLRALNCRCGSILLSKADNRAFLKNLQLKFPDLFSDHMNDAQCMYLNRLIDKKLTVGETGRLFTYRRMDLSTMWAPSQYELFVIKEKQREENEESALVMGQIDPVYKEFIIKKKLEQNEIIGLRYYLLHRRDDFDIRIRRANRKRRQQWQERDKGYVVRFPQTVNDFCKEAVYMCNCLLEYLDAYINNDTDILFIRELDDVNKPFITMEVCEGELMQAYHRFNEDCTHEEAEWIRNYCIRHEIGCSMFQFNREIDQHF